MYSENDILLKKFGILAKKLHQECYFAVFGGFAIDAYYGSFTRVHEDVDIICWRNDVEKIRCVLKNIGYHSRLYEHHQERELIYKMGTDDKNKYFSFQIADRLDTKTFEISFWPYPHLRFPLSYLDVQWKKLGSVLFPVVARQMLIDLKEKEIQLYEKTRKEDIGKYISQQKNKYNKAIHDIELLMAK